jgi:ribose-phosphate pyrophosphokinase
MEHTRKKYPDGGIYAKITDLSHPTINMRINSYEDLFYLKSLKDIFDYNGVKDVELAIPCMFQQQHDRRFSENESFELKLVCDFINSCGFSKVHVFHPHSDVTSALLNNVRVIDNSEFIKNVLKKIPTKPIILSTDAGSYKWINKMADVLHYDGEVYGANKARDPQSHKLTQVIDRQDFQGKDILVIDDLCVFGGTFIGLAKLLKERNIGKLYLAVSHMTVQNPNKELENYYEKVFCTNSKYEQYNLNNLELINIF